MTATGAATASGVQATSPPRPSTPRPDGPAKVTGGACYAADQHAPETLIAALVTASVPTGRIADLDTAAADAAPGVRAVLTHRNLPPLPTMTQPLLGFPVMPLQDPRVHHEGEPVGLVLATSLQQARHGAELVRVRYVDTRPARLFGTQPAVVPDPYRPLGGLHEEVGDVEHGLAEATVTLTETYRTADRHHNPIEPSAALAQWDGDQLTVYASLQSATLIQVGLAELFAVPRDQVRVICPYTGGGFGSKAYLWPQLTLAAAAARVVRRPVKLVLTRAQMFDLSGHQPATRQAVTLGATRDGRLTALRHHSVNAAAALGDYVENATHASTWLYASPAIDTDIRVERLDRCAPSQMRAPHEGTGMFALESAMDELAHELGIDPVELRIRNEPDIDPMTGNPFSSRELVACLHEGAARFGWRHRDPRPRSTRDGDDLVGWGMAVATMETFRAPSSARIRVRQDGTVYVETGMQEIGTGLPSMARAVAANALGCHPDDVHIRHGDTVLPAHGGTVGSMSTMNIGSAIELAAREIREKLGGSLAEPLAARMARAGMSEIDALGTWKPEKDARLGGRSARYSMHTYGAVFAEVRVDSELGLVRVPRIVGRYAAGRIINPVTANSQLVGGVIWGHGQALLEHSVFDPATGGFRSKDLAGYVVPGNADVGDIDVGFVDDLDLEASLIGAKGVGELGAVGVSAAIANAVFHATGVRVRSLPIRIPDLLGIDPHL